MRTTLKRGVGRGAALNGNGRAILPPGAPTPMRRYRQPVPPRPTGLRLVGRILAFFVAAVASLAGAFGGGAYLWAHENVATVHDQSPDARRIARELDRLPTPNHASVALIVGYDRRSDEDESTPSRSDTLMLVRADPQLDAISLLSFPRDLNVPIRCPGRGVWTGKINAAYSLCGLRGSFATVGDLIKPAGVPINYLITVNFRGFTEIVDRLGGVWMDVDRRYLNTNEGRTYGTYAEINLWPGYQRLRGWQALDYVRYRHTDSDFFRVIRQQQFVRALRAQISSSFGVDDLPKIVGSIARNVRVIARGRELDVSTIYRYANFAYKLPPGHIFQSKIEGVSGYADLEASSESILAAVQEFANPDVEAPATSTAVLEGRKPRVPRPDETTVIVLNGNRVEGSATSAAEQLRQRGYQIVLPRSNQTGNAPSFDYEETTLYYNAGYKRAQAAARRLSKLFAPAKVMRLTRIVAPLSNAAMVTVVVGRTFDGTIAPAPTRVIPKREPPDVARNPGATLPLLNAARRRVDFRLEVPTLVEETSTPDPEVPIRVYRIAKRHKAVRLTFRTSTRGYWGIQMTDYDEAPVLADRNFRRSYRGRRFELYYSGRHLHMVVLRENGATYWVVNTLDDALSNETMLAIARGLRPLKGKVGRG